MKSSYLTNLGLILLIAIVYGLTQANFDSSPVDSRLVLLNSQDVHHIEIKQAKRDTIVLEKQDDTWQLIQPLQAEANTTRIKLLLSLLNTSTSSSQTVDAQTNLNRFGINQNSHQLQLNELNFTFGAIEPVSQKRYVTHQNQLFLIEDTVAPLLNTTASSFINNKLISKKITGIEFPLYQRQRITQQRVSLKLEQGHWLTSSNYNTTTDELTKLIEQWQHSAALQVLPYLSIKSTLTETLHPIVLTLAQQKRPLTLSLYLDEQHFFIINPNTQLAYQLPHNYYQQLLLPID